MIVNGSWFSFAQAVPCAQGRDDGARASNVDDMLREACLKFEALFIKEILSAAGLERIFGSSGFFAEEWGAKDSPSLAEASMYTDESLETLAEFLAQRCGLGLGEALYRRLVADNGAVRVPEKGG